MRRWLYHPTVVITAVLVLGIGAMDIKHSIDGRQKLASAGLAPAPCYDLAVSLAVPPEQFHMHRLQAWGTMVGAEDKTVRLRAVPAEQLEVIARQPWVAALAPTGP